MIFLTAAGRDKRYDGENVNDIFVVAGKEETARGALVVMAVGTLFVFRPFQATTVVFSCADGFRIT